MRLVDFLDHSLALSGCQSDTFALNPDEKGRADPGVGFYDLDNDHFLSYQEMVNASIRLAAVLRQKGVKPQDVIATYAPNSVAAYCCIFAISRIGAVWLPLNVKNTLDANLRLIDKAGVSVMFLHQSIAAKYPELINHFGEEQSIFLDGQHIAGLDFSSLVQVLVPDVGMVDLESSTDKDSTVSLLSTGGTTGDSKLAEWSSLTWKTISDIQQQLMPAPDNPSCYLVSAPMSHAAGMASFVAILQGASIIVMDGMVPERLLSVIESHRITHPVLS